MSEKSKIRIGADGELEYVKLDQLEAEYWEKEKPPRFRRLIVVFFSAIGVIFTVSVVGIGVAAGTGNLNKVLCMLVQCQVIAPIPTPMPTAAVMIVYPTIAAVPSTFNDPPCSSEMLADQREKIAFISDRKTEFGAIYLMYVNGVQSCLFLTNEAGISALTLSADRRSILFETSRGWWSVDTNGQNSHFLGAGFTALAQIDANKRSPDGHWLLTDRVEDGVSHTYSVDQDGHETRLTSFTNRVVEASWSPNGKQVVFVTYRDGNNELYLINADGSQMRRLTNDLWNEHSPVWFN